MLKKVTFSGVKTFKKTTIIDFTATKSEILKDTNVKGKILNGGLFFGENGSGKTAALNSISILLDLLFKETTFPGQIICNLLKKKEACFKYEFEQDNNEIVYSFAVNDKSEITEEKLFLNDKEMFSRIKNKVKTILIENDDNDIPATMLFLRVVYFNNKMYGYPILADWMEYLKNSFYIDRTNNRMISFSTSSFKETSLISYLDKYGSEEMNEFLAKYNIPYKIQFKKTTVLGNEFFSIGVENLTLKSVCALELESYGNKLLIQLIPYFLTIKKTGGLLIIDEFGGGCHNKLNELIVDFLFKECSNVQTILVTHETNLLKTSLIRPDQVFILDYDEEGSYISKASDESPRESQNLEKMYLSGIFGGIPVYD